MGTERGSGEMLFVVSQLSISHCFVPERTPLSGQDCYSSDSMRLMRARTLTSLKMIGYKSSWLGLS